MDRSGPYHSARHDLIAARQAGAEVVEMEAAALFAAGAALSIATAAAVVVSDVHGSTSRPTLIGPTRSPPTLAALDAAIDAIRSR